MRRALHKQAAAKASAWVPVAVGEYVRAAVEHRAAVAEADASRAAGLTPGAHDQLIAVGKEFSLLAGGQ